MKIIGHLVNGRTKEYESNVCIGDIVKITNAGKQYTTYRSAFTYFWGDKEPFNVPYEYTSPTLENRENLWMVVNIGVHTDNTNILVLHLRSRDFKNCVIGYGGVKVVKPLKLRPEVLEVKQIKQI